MLRDVPTFLPRVEEFMEYLQEDRSNYINGHRDLFKDNSARNKYQRDWVANYEISDWLKLKYHKNTLFIRNIEPDPQNCDHVEAERLVEEVPFRDFPYSNWFVEVSRNGTTELVAPHLWEGSDGENDIVCIVDLLGHFGVIKPFEVVGDDDSVEEVLVLINTTNNDYLHKPILQWFYQKWFNKQLI
eukprot:TRINITY_DN1269_c5_g2_i1.p1 TRINITY_DN1269_c5_g2~~TRINITY_DN1269_c5_g2_i1.p1  ORF type:complete len:186 (+),score=42.37 TRINITY_DN1269_c5_g2_i1:847-1404(+)